MKESIQLSNDSPLMYYQAPLLQAPANIFSANYMLSIV